MVTSRILAITLALLALCTAPALAVTGPAETGGPLEAQTIMLLKSGPHAASFCTGVILGPRAVLTAAHCVAEPANLRLHYKDAGGAPVLLAVRAVAIHPGYVADGKKRRVVTIDMALVQASEALPDRFATAQLDANAAQQVGDALTVAGFGISREGDASSTGRFRHAAIAVRAPLSKILLWAHDPLHKGLGGCIGDSGGPIYSAAGTVLALTAWADGDAKHQCGDLTQGVLVAPQLLWIQQTLRGWGE